MMVDILLLLVMVLYIIICPFTKVEESFNIQAIHDIIHHQDNLEKYDHLDFPGVVPRTFLGPLFISGLSSPLFLIPKHYGYGKFAGQYIVRAVLGFCVGCSFIKFRHAVSDRFGSVCNWMTLITISQFHFMFYMSRPLPNIFALCLVLLSLSHWLHGNHGRFIWISAFAILVFRSELALLLGIVLLIELLSGRLSIISTLRHSIPAGIIWIALTVCVDSYFWARDVWPEGEVLWYNTILNKSSNWGTSPFLWYFYSVLPRALLTTSVFTIFGLFTDRRTILLFAPCFVFVLLYSFLPHKELRFIIYVFPVLNAIGALGCQRLWRNKHKSFNRRLLAICAVLHLFVNLLASGCFLYVSYGNYPGGNAMDRLHKIEDSSKNVNVHLDVYSCQTGVTRFTELNANWTYDKTEDYDVGSPQMLNHTHLLIAAQSDDDPAIIPYNNTHSIQERIEKTVITFNGLRWLPISLTSKPVIYILKKNES